MAAFRSLFFLTAAISAAAFMLSVGVMVITCSITSAPLIVLPVVINGLTFAIYAPLFLHMLPNKVTSEQEMIEVTSQEEISEGFQIIDNRSSNNIQIFQENNECEEVFLTEKENNSAFDLNMEFDNLIKKFSSPKKSSI